MGDSLRMPTLLSIVLAVVLGGAILMWVLQRVCSLYSECVAPSKADAVSLPKGSFGWPIIGESLTYARDPKEFVHSRVKRYGKILKSSLFLRRSIVGTTPEFAKFVFSNNNLFRRSFPKQVSTILGPNTFMLQDGPPHMSVKKVVLKSIGPEALRTQVHNFESIILEHMASWLQTGTVTGIDAMQKLTWDATNWVLFGDKDCSGTPEGKKNFENFKQIMRALVSLPVNLPGTTFSRGMKARTALIAYFKSLIERSKGQQTTEGVFFGALLAARDDPEGREELKDLDDYTLGENIFLLNFAAYDTTSTTLVWVLKFLLDYPNVFRRVQAEQQEILKSKDPSIAGPRLTWEDTRNMVYTHKFFQEVQRYVSLVPVLFKEAIEDVKFGGYLIPKGWRVLTLTNFIHSDPDNYPDLNFNPDRFDVSPKPYSFLPFSAGPHMCPGMEMARLITLIVIHHLTTTCIHESAAPDKGVEYEGFFPKPRGGYPIKLRPQK